MPAPRVSMPPAKDEMAAAFVPEELPLEEMPRPFIEMLAPLEQNRPPFLPETRAFLSEERALLAENVSLEETTFPQPTACSEPPFAPAA